VTIAIKSLDKRCRLDSKRSAMILNTRSKLPYSNGVNGWLKSILSLKCFMPYPMQGKGPRIVGAEMVAEGMMPGMCDMCLPVARGGHNALYVELKVNKNKPTENQKAVIKKLNKWGNLAIVCWGQDQVKEQLLKYIALEK
jgi:hypothetical protein